MSTALHTLRYVVLIQYGLVCQLRREACPFRLLTVLLMKFGRCTLFCSFLIGWRSICMKVCLTANSYAVPVEIHVLPPLYLDYHTPLSPLSSAS